MTGWEPCAESNNAHVSQLSQERLNEAFDYRDGVLYWRITSGRSKAGTMAGCFAHNGYRQIQLDGVRLYEHRAIWQFFNGNLHPDLVIDHINGNKSDNRIENLQMVDQGHNIRKHWGKNLPRGVYTRGARFRASIQRDRRHAWLGTFDTVEEAEAAIKAAS